jgi:hypothetical protein
MNELQRTAFGNLLAAWNSHESARHADFRSLAEARIALDEARTQMRATSTAAR